MAKNQPLLKKSKSTKSAVALSNGPSVRNDSVNVLKEGACGHGVISSAASAGAVSVWFLS